jgi:hypothetical protein
VRRFLGFLGGLFLVAFVAAACGEIDGSSSTNGGIVPISQSGTYAYTVTITAPSSVPASQCSGLILGLADGNVNNTLNATGSLYFAAGNWTGTLSGGGSVECEWTLTLTPS